MDKFKLEESKKDDKDIGWSETVKRWVDSGHAKKFAEIFDKDEDITVASIYRQIMKNGGNGK